MNALFSLLLLSLTFLTAGCGNGPANANSMTSDRDAGRLGLIGTWFHETKQPTGNGHKMAIQFRSDNTFTLIDVPGFQPADPPVNPGNASTVVGIIGPVTMGLGKYQADVGEEGGLVKLSASTIVSLEGHSASVSVVFNCRYKLTSELFLDCDLWHGTKIPTRTFQVAPLQPGVELNFETAESFIDFSSSGTGMIPITGPVAYEYKTEEMKYRSYLLNQKVIERSILNGLLNPLNYFPSFGDPGKPGLTVNGMEIDLIPLALKDRVIDFSIQPPLYSAPIPEAIYPDDKGSIYSIGFKLSKASCTISLQEKYFRSFSSGKLSAFLRFDFQATLDKELHDYAEEQRILKYCLGLAKEGAFAYLRTRKIGLHATLASN